MSCASNSKGGFFYLIIIRMAMNMEHKGSATIQPATGRKSERRRKKTQCHIHIHVVTQ